MLSLETSRKIGLRLVSLVLVGALIVAVIHGKVGTPSDGINISEQMQLDEYGYPIRRLAVLEVPALRASRKWNGVTMDDIGVFSGLVIQQDFKTAAFWDRKCPIHHLEHGTEKDSEVYTAAYNECTGVSDVIYYRVNAGKFTVGAGRGGSWRNDPELVDLMKDLGKKQTEYATVSDYQGCGLFALDRGHQAPVGSYNADEEAATMTNTPTNLSPQNGFLNQKPWMWLEKEMRVKASETEKAPRFSDEIELLTGPLYELPEAFFTNTEGKRLWEDLLWRGGDVNNKAPWCKEKDGDDGFRSTPLKAISGNGFRPEKTTCHTGRSKMKKASENPNKLKLHYQRKERNFPLRIPLGYFKLAVVHDESHHSRQTCPYIMDQTGQCLLVSLETLTKLAHIDLGKTEFADLGGTEHRPSNSDHEYSAEVDPDFCIRKGMTLDKKKACYVGSHDAEEITVEMMEDYWDQREKADFIPDSNKR